MIPRVILHNSISINGSAVGFSANIGLHYEIARSFQPNVHLVGSETAKAGAEARGIAQEKESDTVKPQKPDTLPYWAVVDSSGKLEGFLHMYRQYEHCRDVIVLTSDVTPESYRTYLTHRQYDEIRTKGERVNLREGLEVLGQKYAARTILVDSGGVLNAVLLSEGLVDTISILIHPEIAAGSHKQFLGPTVAEGLGKVRLMGHTILHETYIHLVYSVVRTPSPR